MSRVGACGTCRCHRRMLSIRSATYNLSLPKAPLAPLTYSNYPRKLVDACESQFDLGKYFFCDVAPAGTKFDDRLGPDYLYHMSIRNDLLNRKVKLLTRTSLNVNLSLHVMSTLKWPRGMHTCCFCRTFTTIYFILMLKTHRPQYPTLP